MIVILVTLAVGVLLIGFIQYFMSLAVKPAASPIRRSGDIPPPQTPAELSEAETSSKPKQHKRNKHHTQAFHKEPIHAPQKHEPKPTHPMFICQLKGHTEPVSCIRFSDEFLASVAGDRTIRLWSRSSFERKDSHFIPKVQKVPHESDTPLLVTITPDAAKIATSTQNQQSVRMLTRSGSGYSHVEPSNILPHKEEIISLGASTGFVMSCSGDTTMNIWNWNGELVKDVNTSAVKNFAAVVSPDGRFVALGGFLSGVRIFEVKVDKPFGAAKSIAPAFSLNGHKRGITGIAFSRDAKTVLTISKDGTAKLWDIDVRWQQQEDAKLIKSVELEELGFSSAVSHVLMPPSTKHGIFVSESSFAIWSFSDAKVICRVNNAHIGSICSADISADGMHLATAAQAGKEIHVWDFSSFTE